MACSEVLPFAGFQDVKRFSDQRCLSPQSRHCLWRDFHQLPQLGLRRGSVSRATKRKKSLAMATWSSLPGFLFYNVLPMIMMNWMTFVILTVLLVCFAVFKDRILLALAGDRKFHGDVLSSAKGALGVCCCSCGWKTWCAPCLGCCHCMELPFVRLGCCSTGADNIQECVLWFQDSINRMLGLTPRTLIISKVVAGDLPLEQDGDFFFSIDCGVSPEQRSSVEESDGYAVQFADNMLCRVRHSHFEQPVNISIWRLHFMAPTKLCEVYLTPKVLFNLAKQKEENWRIAMHVNDTSAPHAHPWICFDIREDDDKTFKSHYASLPSSRASEDSIITSPLNCMQSWRSASVLNMAERHASFHELKQQRENLYDQNMKKMIKTDKDVEDHRHSNGRWMKRACLGSFFLLVLIMIPRFYIMSCYHQYQWLTVGEAMDRAARSNLKGDRVGEWYDKLVEIRGSDALWTAPELHSMWMICEKETLGLDDQTLAKADGMLKHCRPTKQEVANTCFEQSKSLQPEPRAFKDVMDLLENNGGVGHAVVHQMRQVDNGIHASFPKSTSQYTLTGGFRCPCEIVTLRNYKVLGIFPLHVLVDLLIWILAVAVVVLRCYCMPHRCCEIANMQAV